MTSRDWKVPLMTVGTLLDSALIVVLGLLVLIAPQRDNEFKQFDENKSTTNNNTTNKTETPTSTDESAEFTTTHNKLKQS